MCLAYGLHPGWLCGFLQVVLAQKFLSNWQAS